MMKPAITESKTTTKVLSLLFIGSYQIALLWVLLPALVAAISTVGLSVEQEHRYHNLLRELRCLVCQNQSLAESDAGLAVDLRDQVKTMIIAGSSDAEIYTFMTERYGDFVLYKPPFKPQNYILWIAPFLLLLIGLTVLMKRVLRQAPTKDHLD